MLLELGTASAAGTFPGLALFQVNLIAIVLIWASTFSYRCPAYRLSEAFSEAAHRQLVQTVTGYRTVLWTGLKIGGCMLW